MTNEELEMKADKKSLSYDTKYSEDRTLKDMLSRPQAFVEGAIEGIVNLLRQKAYRDGYIVGAKENGVVWHDLRVNPLDLPKGPINRYLFGYVKKYRSKRPMLISYNGEWFYDANTYNTEVKVIAWCEIPLFEGE